MKTSKKMLSLLLIAAMLASMLCMSVFAADAPVIAGNIHAQFGDPDATPTAPESLMSLVRTLRTPHSITRSIPAVTAIRITPMF